MSNNIKERTSVEEAYLAYLETPRTSIDMRNHFGGVSTNAVWQMTRTLRLKGLAHRVHDRWRITKQTDNVKPVQITPLQREYLKYLQSPHTTKEMMKAFGRRESAVQQLTRTLRLGGHVESIGNGSPTGRGGCWYIYQISPKGRRALGDAER